MWRVRHRLRRPKRDEPEFDTVLDRQLTEPSPAFVVLPTEAEPDHTPPPVGVDFWARHDEAKAAADLFDVPPADIIAIVGPLDAAFVVARRCLDHHWDHRCAVSVLTNRRQLAVDRWEVLAGPNDLVRALTERGARTPMLIIDVPSELPPWLQPLTARLRREGLDLVRYVLDGHPTDEDLASWHGTLGRPSVLDLTGPVDPDRVVELLERGEPIASVAGSQITAELLLALDLELLDER